MTGKRRAGRIKIDARITYDEWRAGLEGTRLENQKVKGKVILQEKSEANIIKTTFPEAKTIAAANEFATKTLGIARAEYKGCAIEAANEWNRALLETFTRFPELKKNFNFVGEAHERNALCEMELGNYFHRILKAQLPERAESLLRRCAETKASQVILTELKISRDTCAQSLTSNHPIKRKFAGVTMNRDIGNSYEKFLEAQRYNEQIKFHPVGCGTVRSVLDHEVGHQLDELLNLRDLPEVQALFDSRVTLRNGAEDFSQIAEDLSRYAWSNDNPNRYSEFIAEGWAEYCNNPSPREMARKLGEIIRREYTKKFAR